MRSRILLASALPLLYLVATLQAVQGASITICTFNKDAYYQGQTGYLSVTIFNDQEDKIRITDLTATIDYYYTDGNVYMQTFLTNATLPREIEQGQSGAFYIPLSLPTNIAPGYTLVYVHAFTEMWHEHSETWGWSEHPTYEPRLYVESPYKPLYEGQQEDNHELQGQLSELQTVNNSTTSIMYLLAITTIAFALVAAVLVLVSRRTRAIGQPLA